MNEFGVDKSRPKGNNKDLGITIAESFWTSLQLSRNNSSIDNLNRSHQNVSRLFRTTNDSSFLHLRSKQDNYIYTEEN